MYRYLSAHIFSMCRTIVSRTYSRLRFHIELFIVISLHISSPSVVRLFQALF